MDGSAHAQSPKLQYTPRKNIRGGACAETQSMSHKQVPEIIDQLFVKTSPIRSFSMTENERFGLVFTKTRVYKFGHRLSQAKFLLVLLVLKFTAVAAD
jgi:hypothetical protein